MSDKKSNFSEESDERDILNSVDSQDQQPDCIFNKSKSIAAVD